MSSTTQQATFPGKMSEEFMRKFCYEMVEYSWFTLYMSEHEKQLIDEFCLLLKQGLSAPRDEWNRFKAHCLVLVGSGVASVLSKLASAWRSPDVSISSLVAACEKYTEVCAENQKKFTQNKLQNNLTICRKSPAYPDKGSGGI